MKGINGLGIASNRLKETPDKNIRSFPQSVVVFFIR
jgi:hypothetical protein